MSHGYVPKGDVPYRYRYRYDTGTGTCTVLGTAPVRVDRTGYNDIAQQAFLVMEDTSHAKEHPSGPSTSTTAFVDKREGFEGFVIGLAEQIYSVLLLIFFFIEVSLVGLLPYIGVPAKFILLSWMYSYYCFEYKWNLADFGCKERLDLFHTNWSFFAGFGSPCALAIFFFSPLVSGGVMAILFPLTVGEEGGRRKKGRKEEEEEVKEGGEGGRGRREAEEEGKEGGGRRREGRLVFARIPLLTDLDVFDILPESGDWRTIGRRRLEEHHRHRLKPFVFLLPPSLFLSHSVFPPSSFPLSLLPLPPFFLPHSFPSSFLAPSFAIKR
ncbi:EI24-like protein [Nymphaea thermarum]|nr:EI24-like protein [Nymphaea thermarum]